MMPSLYDIGSWIVKSQISQFFENVDLFFFFLFLTLRSLQPHYPIENISLLWLNR